MKFWIFVLIGLGFLGLEVLPVAAQGGSSNCPAPALSRVKYHLVAAGETLESVAIKYNLTSATLVGMNPGLKNGVLPVGEEIVIPPFNGRRVEVNYGESWKRLSEIYNVRADVLFEVNGCVEPQGVVFIPGVNSSQNNREVQRAVEVAAGVISGFPLPEKASVILGYGLGFIPLRNTQAFHAGIDLEAKEGTPVLAVGEGTIAFAGMQGSYGNLVVINHAFGKQTRYAHLASISVRVGEKINRGQLLGTVGKTGNPDINEAHLHFEVRSSSAAGWVAEDPQNYFKNGPVGVK
ncbi:MAG TPA: M23 family metallopeptidase [Halomicronema sp.]